MTTGRLLAVCVSGADLVTLPGRTPQKSGIRKTGVDGRVAVHALGLDGDVQVNKRHHGEGQAVYAYAQDDADWWAAELDRELPPGRFGENLRISGVDHTGALLGERWRIGTALFEVTGPRIPCAKFAAFWGDVPRLVKLFTARGTSGAYLRVLETGEVGAGDAVDVVWRPDHGITTGVAFRLFTTEQHRLPELAPALEFLPHKDQPKIAAEIAERTEESA